MTVPAEKMAERFDRSCRTLVVGLGETGLSVARYLLRHGVTVAIVDSRENPPGLARLRNELPADIALFLGGFRDEAFARAPFVEEPRGEPSHLDVVLLLPACQQSRTVGGCEDALAEREAFPVTILIFAETQVTQEMGVYQHTL